MSQLVAQGTNAAGGLNIPTTVETVCVSTPVFACPRDTTTVLVWGFFILNPGTATTSINIFLRRGVGGAGLNSPINVAQIVVGQNGTFVHMVTDTLVGFSTMQYSLSVAQVAATGNGTMNGAALFALGLF